MCVCVWSSLQLDAELSSEIWDSEVTTEGQGVQKEEGEKPNGLRSLVRSLSFLGKMARNYKVGERKQGLRCVFGCHAFNLMSIVVTIKGCGVFKRLLIMTQLYSCPLNLIALIALFWVLNQSK